MELVFSLSRACPTNFQWKTFVYGFPLFFFHLEPNFFRLQHLSRCTLSIFFSVFTYSPDFHTHFLFHRYLCNWNQTIASALVERRSRCDNRTRQNDELRSSYLAVIDTSKSLNIGMIWKTNRFTAVLNFQGDYVLITLNIPSFQCWSTFLTDWLIINAESKSLKLKPWNLNVDLFLRRTDSPRKNFPKIKS